MLILCTICTMILTVFTLLPISRNPHWLVRGLDFPRLQIACFAVLLLIVEIVYLDLHTPATWLLLISTLFCILWQLWWIVPYTRLWPSEVQDANRRDPERELSILTSNVLTTNRNAAALIHLIQTHQPDIVVTLESDQWWEDQLAAIEQAMPHSIKCPLDNLYGMHVYSRLPLLETETSFLVEDDVPSMHALVQMRSGEKIRIHFVHPAPPSPTENPESKERDAELTILGRSIADSTQPIIVTGDLNDVAWSPTTRLFRKLSGLLDPRVGRGMYNTFHAKYPCIRWPLDHLFHSAHFTLHSIDRLPAIGSDHFPLLTCLTLSNEEKDQDGLSADESEQKWADQITKKQNVHKKDVPEPGEE